MNFFKFSLLIILFFGCSKTEDPIPPTSGANSREIAEMLNLPLGVKDDSYIHWDGSLGVLEFVKNVTFSNGSNQTEIDNDIEGFYYVIPSNVNEIILDENITVTGHFRFNSNVIIKGKSRETSIIYGTPTKAWSLGPNTTNDSPDCYKTTGDDRAADCKKWEFGAISGNLDGITLTVNNLTIRNARSYAVTSFRSKIIMDNVYVHNSRPSIGGADYNSNSDGFGGGKNSIVRNCKFDTWDDSIKLYLDMTVENVTIVQNGNGAAFQLGWSNKSNTVHTLKNILIVTNNKGYSNLTTFAISGTNANLNTVINLGDFYVKIDADQTFRNTGKSLPIFLNKSSGVVNVILNEVGSNYYLAAPLGFAEYTNQGTNPVGNFQLFGNICGKSILDNNTLINCGLTANIVGCGW